MFLTAKSLVLKDWQEFSSHISKGRQLSESIKYRMIQVYYRYAVIIESNQSLMYDSRMADMLNEILNTGSFDRWYEECARDVATFEANLVAEVDMAGCFEDGLPGVAQEVG